MIDLGHTLSMLAFDVLLGLPLAVLMRWAMQGWMPVTTPDEPLDFACLTIAGIPVEMLGLPEAEWELPRAQVGR